MANGRALFSVIPTCRLRGCKNKADSYIINHILTTDIRRGGGTGGVNIPSPYFLSQFLPPPYFFEPISPSSLNGYVSFSPFSLLFPHIFPSSQLFLGHFSLLPILFLPPLFVRIGKNSNHRSEIFQ